MTRTRPAEDQRASGRYLDTTARDAEDLAAVADAAAKDAEATARIVADIVAQHAEDLAGITATTADDSQAHT
ncbi:hypothetical protein [Micrococcus luteus]